MNTGYLKDINAITLWSQLIQIRPIAFESP